MTGLDLKNARLKRGWTQEQAADKLGVTQAYLSMVEQGRRPLSSRLVARVQKSFHIAPTMLPLNVERSQLEDSEKLKSELGALGYTGFSYLRGKPTWNPAQVLFTAVSEPNLEPRVVEALPWLAWEYADLDWEWVVSNAKVHDRQNRLGYVVTLAKKLAEKRQDILRFDNLSVPLTALEHARLVREDTLCHDSMTQAERKWLRQNRPREARHWNLLTDLRLENLPYASA
jgi:transcriptional regulator with XRE-family HTH domain